MITVLLKSSVHFLFQLWKLHHDPTSCDQWDCHSDFTKWSQLSPNWQAPSCPAEARQPEETSKGGDQSDCGKSNSEHSRVGGERREETLCLKTRNRFGVWKAFGFDKVITEWSVDQWKAFGKLLISKTFLKLTSISPNCKNESLRFCYLNHFLFSFLESTC